MDTVFKKTFDRRKKKNNKTKALNVKRHFLILKALIHKDTKL